MERSLKMESNGLEGDTTGRVLSRSHFWREREREREKEEKDACLYVLFPSFLDSVFVSTKETQRQLESL
jgi:hypothetical protein